MIFKYFKNICKKEQVLNASQLNTFLGVDPECYIFSPSSFCSYLIARIAGSHSLIALRGGNLVLQPPGGDVPLLFTYYQRKERLRNLEEWRGQVLYFH